MSFGGGGSGSGSLAGSSDVAISSPQNKQILAYSSSSIKWVNSGVTAGDVGAVPLASGGQAMRVVGYGTSLPSSGQTGDIFFLQTN